MFRSEHLSRLSTLKYLGDLGGGHQHALKPFLLVTGHLCYDSFINQLIFSTSPLLPLVQGLSVIFYVKINILGFAGHISSLSQPLNSAVLHNSSHRQYVDERPWLCCRKSLFTEIGSWLDVTRRPLTATIVHFCLYFLTYFLYYSSFISLISHCTINSSLLSFLLSPSSDTPPSQHPFPTIPLLILLLDL